MLSTSNKMTNIKFLTCIRLFISVAAFIESALHMIFYLFLVWDKSQPPREFFKSHLCFYIWDTPLSHFDFKCIFLKKINIVLNILHL